MSAEWTIGENLHFDCYSEMEFDFWQPLSHLF